MKAFRVSASIVALATLSVLAACGGGGGGGSVTPPGGGGGGGSTPTPTTSSTPATTPTPTTTPTPLVTPTPTASASSPPGNIAANLSINAANATDGTNNTPPPGGTPEPGYQNGTDGWYTSGTTASENTDGDTSSGGTGNAVASGGTNLSCSLMTEPTGNSIYHVHAFIGILVNKGTALPQNWVNSGAAFAIPDAVGMVNPNDPGGALGGQIVQPNNGGCFYVIHAHAESGVIHFEDPNSGQILGIGSGTAKYSLQNVLDVWGMTLSAIGSAVGGSGSPTIIFGVPTTTIGGSGCGHPCDEVVTYTAVANPTQVMLSRHSAVWLIWGGIPTGGPPPVVFRIEN